MRDHRKLRAFELADEVAVLVYQTTAQFPKEEMYGVRFVTCCYAGKGHRVV